MIIKTKIITIIALTIILTVGTTTAIVIEMQKRTMAGTALHETKLICDLIESSAESAFSEGKTADVQKILESAGRDREIMKLRVLSPEGIVLESMDRSEIGSIPAGLSAAALNTLYKSPAFVSDTRINYFRGIPNRGECVGCHGSQKKILGIFQITRDMSGNHNNFLPFERLMLLSCLAVVLIVSAALSSVFSRLVMNPLKSLLSAMRQVEAGNWNAEAKVGRDDELGEIATSFNKMIREVNNIHGKNILKERELLKVRVELEHKAKVEELNSQLEFNIRGLEAANDAVTALSNEVNNKNVALERAVESLKNSYFATIQSLVNALEASDRFTRGHSERVRLLSVELGKHLGLELKELELLEHASILHDIGKIGIDNFVLQKQGKLTSREYGLVKTHPLIGDEILGPIETLEGVRKTIIQHHERYDGTGYPYGLKGDEILLKARILSVVDTFDAMMTDRPYRKAIGLKQVMNELRTNAGTQFDPGVVLAFVEMLESKGDDILPGAGYNTLLSI